MPRYRNRVPGELRTFGDFLRDYKEESSFDDRADARARARTFGDFNEWLASQPGSRDPSWVARQKASALALSSRLVASAANRLEGDVLSSPEAGYGRNPTLSEVSVQPENKVARNLRIAAKASAADGRMYDPSKSVRSIYGTMFDASFHSRLHNPVHLRRLKRREVLFARGSIGGGATRSNRAL